MCEYNNLLDNHYSILKKNDLCIKNTFIDIFYENNIYKFKKCKSLNDLIILDDQNIANIIKDFKNSKIYNKKKDNNNILIKNKKKKKNILTNEELINDIMLDVDLYIIKKGVYDEINSHIENFRKHNINILSNIYNKNDRKLNANILCINKYIKTATAIYLSNIRNKIYLDLLDNFEKLKKDKILKVYIDETLILRFREYEENITRTFESHIVLWD